MLFKNLITMVFSALWNWFWLCRQVTFLFWFQISFWTYDIDWKHLVATFSSRKHLSQGHPRLQSASTCQEYRPDIDHFCILWAAVWNSLPSALHNNRLSLTEHIWMVAYLIKQWRTPSCTIVAFRQFWLCTYTCLTYFSTIDSAMRMPAVQTRDCELMR